MLTLAAAEAWYRPTWYISISSSKRMSWGPSMGFTMDKMALLAPVFNLSTNDISPFQQQIIISKPEVVRTCGHDPVRRPHALDGEGELCGEHPVLCALHGEQVDAGAANAQVGDQGDEVVRDGDGLAKAREVAGLALGARAAATRLEERQY